MPDQCPECNKLFRTRAKPGEAVYCPKCGSYVRRKPGHLKPQDLPLIITHDKLDPSPDTPGKPIKPFEKKRFKHHPKGLELLEEGSK